MELIAYIQKGGMIMYILLGLNVLGFTLMIFKGVHYMVLYRKQATIIAKIYEVLLSYHADNRSKIGEDMLREKLIRYEKGLNTIKIIASIAPLLGLLGTVMGVLFAFEAISKQGLGDPSVFSSGIALALITTVGGLVVAIPHYIGYNYLVGMLDKLEVGFMKELHQKLYGAGA